MSDPMTEGAETGTRELCLYCQFPIANQQEWDDIPPGEGFHLCWGVCSERHDVESLLRQSRSDLTEALKVAGELGEVLKDEIARAAKAVECNTYAVTEGYVYETWQAMADEHDAMIEEWEAKRDAALAALERIRKNKH